MSFARSDEGSTTTVFLSGEIDLERSPEARRQLLEVLAQRRGLVVDLAGVRYMDSSGLASLVEAYQRAKSAQLEFALARVGEGMLKLLRLARLDEVFPIRSVV